MTGKRDKENTNELRKPNRKKLLALLLSASMCLTMFPAGTAGAERNTGVPKGLMAEESFAEPDPQASSEIPEFLRVYLHYPDDCYYEYDEDEEEYTSTIVTYLGNTNQMDVPKEHLVGEGGRRIIGWSTEETGSERTPVDFSQLPVDKAIQNKFFDLHLYPIMDQYRITFCDNYFGNEKAPVFVPAGSTLSEETLQGPQGITFAGWFVLNENGAQYTKFDFQQPVYHDSTLNAMWFGFQVVEFYYPDDFLTGGEDNYQTVYVPSGQPVKMPVETMSNGYRNITGWTTDPDGAGEPFDFNQPVTESLSLYPIVNKYLVRFDGWDYWDDEILYEENVYVEKGTTISKPQIEITGDEDHIFNGWRYTDDEGDEALFDFTKPVNRDYRLYTSWNTIDYFYVEFCYPDDFYDGSNDWYEKQYVKVREGTPVPKPWIAEDNGQRKILGWTKTPGGTEPFDFTKPMTEEDMNDEYNLVLYPILDRYLVEFDAENGDENHKVYVKEGQTVQPPNVSKEHYILKHWYNSDLYDEEETAAFDFRTPVYRDYRLCAEWQKDFNFTIKLWDYDSVNYNSSWNDFAKLCYVTNGTSYQDAVFSEEDYPKPVREGYTFAGWYYDAECTKECRQGSRFDPAYYQPEYDWYEEAIPKLTLYAGWKKNGRDPVSGYRMVSYHYGLANAWSGWSWASQDFLVEKGTVLAGKLGTLAEGETKKESYSDGISYVASEAAFYADEKLTRRVDMKQPVAADMDVYFTCKYDFTIHYKLISYDGVTEHVEKMSADIYFPSLINLPEPKRAGYTFTGWYFDSTCTNRYSPGTEFHSWGGHSVLCAGWQRQDTGKPDYSMPNINYYKINFVYNYKEYGANGRLREDGTWYPSDAEYKDVRNRYNCNQVIVERGQSAAYYKDKVDDPVIPGHYFAGWYLDEAGTIPFDFHMVPTKDLMVYAKWGTNADGSVITPQNGIEVKPGENPQTAAASVTLSQTYAMLPKGSSLQLSATVLPADTADKTVRWRSSDSSIASVSAGKVTAKKAGTATIYAAAANGTEAECDIVVADVQWNAKTAVLKINTSSKALQIAMKYPASDKVKSYQSSKPSIVKVNKKGQITAGKKTGKATITVTMKSGASASCVVTVQKKKVVTKSLKLSSRTLKLKKGKSIRLTAVRSPITATEKITWSSSNAKVVKADKKGKIKALKKGKATITAKTSNGRKATCKVTVR